MSAFSVCDASALFEEDAVSRMVYCRRPADPDHSHQAALRDGGYVHWKDGGEPIRDAAPSALPARVAAMLASYDEHPPAKE